MSGEQVSDYAAQISTLMAERLRIKGRSLDAQIHKSGRRLPRRIKRDAAFVAQANTLIANPKLARMVDVAAVRRAGDNVIAHLQTIDPRKIAIDRILRTLAKFSAVLIITFIAVIWYARSRGLI